MKMDIEVKEERGSHAMYITLDQLTIRLEFRKIMRLSERNTYFIRNVGESHISLKDEDNRLSANHHTLMHVYLDDDIAEAIRSEFKRIKAEDEER